MRSDWQSEGGGEDGLEAGGGAEAGEVQQCERVAGLQELEDLEKEGGEEDQAVSQKGRSRDMMDYNKSLLQPTSSSHLQPSQHSREGRCEEGRESRRK